MPSRFRVLTATLVLLATVEVDLLGRQLLERDGVELRGNAQLVLSGGGTCNVFESDTSYEERKGNHGAPMDIWRLDFSVHNGSGRWLDHLIARFQIDSAWPECTNWDVPQARRFAQPIEWTGSNGHIQESGRNVVAPGRTLTHTKFFIVLRGDPEPRFSNWSMDFDFAAGPPTVNTAAGAGGAPSVATPEQENLFWQSIMNSTDPADFESYLEQFPNGVFRSLAQNRLRALEKTPRADQSSRVPAAWPDRPEPPRVLAPICDGLEGERNCWRPLPQPPGCHVWNPGYHPDFAVTWTGACEDGVATGPGILTWDTGRNWEDRWKHEARGSLHDGKKHGHWVERNDPYAGLYPNTEQGPYVDGKRHGRWVERSDSGRTDEGSYVDGLQHGRWVEVSSSGATNTTFWSRGKLRR